MLLKVLPQLLSLEMRSMMLRSVKLFIIVKVVALSQCTLSMKGVRAAFFAAVDGKADLYVANDARFLAFSRINSVNFNRSL